MRTMRLWEQLNCFGTRSRFSAARARPKEHFDSSIPAQDIALIRAMRDYNGGFSVINKENVVSVRDGSRLIQIMHNMDLTSYPQPPQ
ncbi:MAG: hypothetical protein ACYDCG_04390 [Candidatus Acidiferrales bacterium]